MFLFSLAFSEWCQYEVLTAHIVSCLSPLFPGSSPLELAYISIIPHPTPSPPGPHPPPPPLVVPSMFPCPATDLRVCLPAVSLFALWVHMFPVFPDADLSPFRIRPKSIPSNRRPFSFSPLPLFSFSHPSLPPQATSLISSSAVWVLVKIT